MIALLRRFFDDIHKIANMQQEVVVTLSPEDRNLLANFHRRKPRVKKETV